MTEQEKQKLNEKLAEWIGFEVHLIGTPTGKPEMWQSMGKIGGYTNRGWVNFTDSLDACFKWLVPKLQSEYEISIVTDDVFRNRGTTRVTLTHVIKGRHGIDRYYPLEYLGMDKNPALALCLAIEKLIPQEKETLPKE